MSSSTTFSGLVLDSGNNAPIADASIRLKTPSGNYFATSNANGQFSFKGIVEPEGQSYQVILYAHATGGYVQDGPPLTLNWEKGQQPPAVEVLLENRGPSSNTAGIIFLIALVGILLALGTYYFKSHSSGEDELAQENPELVKALTEDLASRVTLDSAKVANYKPQTDSLDSLFYINLIEDFQQIEQGANQLLKASMVDTAYYPMVEQKLKDIHQAILKNNQTETVTALVNLKQSIKQIPQFSPSWFWQEVPGRYAEIILWALFASLLRLIGGTSYYVSRNNFYRNSIPHKLALLFTIPLIALIISFVFSFFKIIFVVGEENYAIDFTSPYMSVVLASLIGLAPWKAWKLMNGLAEKLFDSLNKTLALNKEPTIPAGAPANPPAADQAEEVPDADPVELEKPADIPAIDDDDTPTETPSNNDNTAT